MVRARRVRRRGRAGRLRPARGDFSIEAVAETAILPYLRTLGDRWRDGDASVAQEHFATGLLRARLLGLARGWDRGAGPRALLACPSGERHDLGLIILGLALRDRGWRVTFLGPDTPIETLAAAADQLAPDVVVLSSLAREPLAAAVTEIAQMAASRPVLLAGPGADAELAERSRARLLAGNPIEAADECPRSASDRVRRTSAPNAPAARATHARGPASARTAAERIRCLPAALRRAQVSASRPGRHEHAVVQNGASPVAMTASTRRSSSRGLASGAPPPDAFTATSTPEPAGDGATTSARRPLAPPRRRPNAEASPCVSPVAVIPRAVYAVETPTFNDPEGDMSRLRCTDGWPS